MHPKEAGIQIGQASIQHAATVDTTVAASGTAVSAAGEHHPVSVLNEQTQQGRIEAVAWTVNSTGPSHAPHFTTAASTRLLATNTSVRGEGSGASKAAARAAAAVALLACLDTV
ncbi:putative dsRNA-binding protein [Streptosporangium amethystogenes]|uniref:putative dsRNA-binding protein n=1 Tax=Streptosporangium amethystogenes TaxID=2002 RepID=UPI00378F39A4